MLTNEIKATVQKLDPFDKALLIEFLFENLSRNEDNEILQAWTIESQKRLEAVKSGKLNLVEYADVKNRIK